MVTGIVNIVKEVPQKIYNSISAAISKVAQWGTEVKNKAVEGMNNCVNGIKNAFANIGNDFVNIGSNIVQGIWNGIGNAWNGGVFLAQGIGVGFSDEMGKVNKQIEDNIPQEFDIGAKVNVDKDFTYDWDGDGNPKKPKPKGGGAPGSFFAIPRTMQSSRKRLQGNSE